MHIQKWIIFCIVCGLMACGTPDEPPSDNNPPDMSPKDQPGTQLPDAAYVGTVMVVEDGQNVEKKAHLTLFKKGQQHEGTLFVVLDETTNQYALYPTTVQTKETGLDLKFDKPSCSTASLCDNLGEASSLSGTLNRTKLQFNQPKSIDGIQRIALTIDPDFYREPDDGLRPSDVCDEEKEDCPNWPPPLAQRPDDFTIYGGWDGNIYVMPEFHTPYAAHCELFISDRGDPRPLFEAMSCISTKNNEVQYQRLVRHKIDYNKTPTATLFTWFNGRIWRFDGKLNAQLIKQDKHKLYRFYGHIEVSDPVDEATNPDDIKLWHTAGTFAFTSWGE